MHCMPNFNFYRIQSLAKRLLLGCMTRCRGEAGGRITQPTGRTFLLYSVCSHKLQAVICISQVSQYESDLHSIITISLQNGRSHYFLGFCHSLHVKCLLVLQHQSQLLFVKRNDTIHVFTQKFFFNQILTPQVIAGTTPSPTWTTRRRPGCGRSTCTTQTTRPGRAKSCHCVSTTLDIPPRKSTKSQS